MNVIEHETEGAGEPTHVVGARRVRIDDAETAAALIKQAGAARASESTAMNAASSRSHSVFMLFITGRHAPTATLVQGALNLVDLAGRYTSIWKLQFFIVCCYGDGSG